ncbi:hypothetical protein ACFSHQ_08610 [Gemmobacter lanyuensis]
MLGIEAPLNFHFVLAAFTEAGVQIWHNFLALFTSDVTQWDKLIDFSGSSTGPTPSGRSCRGSFSVS